MKKYLLFFSVVAGFLGVSCEKPVDIIEKEANSEPKTYTVTIGFNSPVKLETKSGLNDDKVERLDIYYYNYRGEFLGHETFTGSNALSQQLVLSMDERTELLFLAFANLPEDIATYITQVPMTYGSYPHIYFPFEFQKGLDYPVMGATAQVFLDSDKEVKMDLYRYIYKIEVGRITADFSIDSMKNKPVTVKRIVLINCGNKYDLLHKLDEEMPKSIYGLVDDFDYEIFGGGNTGYYLIGGHIGKYSTFSMEYENLREDWDIEYNSSYNTNNENKDAGTIIVDAEGIAEQASVINFSDNTIIGTSDNGLLNTTIDVNRTLVGLVANYTAAPKPLNAGIYNQDNTLKLVIEVEVDGTTMFYPIQILQPQPNTVYRIDNITLKGAPSPYCNVYPISYDSYSETTVSAITEISVNNIMTGANPETGELL